MNRRKRRRTEESIVAFTFFEDSFHRISSDARAFRLCPRKNLQI